MNLYIQKAIDLCGDQKTLADRVGLHPSFIGQLLRGDRPVPATRCAAFESASGGLITKEQLRPDVFGQPSSGEAA